jgi:CRP-like cAMP-binding protein
MEEGRASSSPETVTVGGTWMHKRVPRTSDKDKSTRRRRLLAWTTVLWKDRYQRRYFEVQPQLKRLAYYRNDPVHRQTGTATPAGVIEFAQIVRCTRGPFDPHRAETVEDEGSQQSGLRSPATSKAALQPSRVRRASLPSALTQSEATPTKWMFNVHCKNGRVFTMCTDSESTLEQWMQLMMSEIGESPPRGEMGAASGDATVDDTAAANTARSTLDAAAAGFHEPRPRREEVADIVDPSHADARSEQRTVPSKDDVVKRMLLRILQENVLFTQAREQRDLQAEIVDAFELMNVSAGALIVRQGDCEGESLFYVVESGDVVVVSDTNERCASPPEPLRPGSCFGELALMYDLPRSETFRASSEVRLWTLQRDTFRFLLARAQTRRTRKYARFLAAVEIKHNIERFRDRAVRLADILAAEDIEKLCDCLTGETYEPEQTIIRQGDAGDSCFIIEHGQVAVRQERGKGAKMTGATADPMSSFMHTRASALGPGQFFGEKALLGRDARHASYDAATLCKCLILSRSDFVGLFGDLTERVERYLSAAPTGSMVADAGATLNAATLHAPPLPPPLLVTTPRLEKLTAICTVGVGTFGPVKLVRHDESERSFALKCISKEKVVQKNSQEHVLRERRLLQKIDSNFVVKVYGGLKDDRYLYFLLEFLPGRDLYHHLYERSPTSVRGNGRAGFTEDAAKIYAASTLIALEHIHAHRIAHRDLKPESLCLDRRGYPKLVDFGLAKVCNGKTFTVCGTSDYLSPEVVTSEGHDSGVDLWALGVLIFELVCGETPFTSPDLMHKYETIVSRDYSWNIATASPSLKSIVGELLTEQRRRLGNGNSSSSGCRMTAAVRTHPWFRGVDWDALERQELPEMPITVTGSEWGAAARGGGGRIGGQSTAAETASARCAWEPQFL